MEPTKPILRIEYKPDPEPAPLAFTIRRR
jgi:hypothetical protein